MTMRTILFVGVLMMCVPLLATPSSIVTIPSTDIQPQGILHLGVDSIGNSDGALVDVGLTYGASQRVELGIDLITGTDAPLWGNGKLLLLSPDDSPIALAAGVYNVGATSASNQSIAYLVGSHTFAGTRVTFGGYRGRSAGLGGDDAGVLLGLDRTMGRWWAGADYAGGNNAIGSWNVGVGYALSDQIGVIVGFDHYNNGAPATMNFQLDVNL